MPDINWDALVNKYGSPGKAAGAVALGIERLDAYSYLWLPEPVRSLILFKLQQATLKLGASTAGTSLQHLQDLWKVQDGTD